MANCLILLNDGTSKLLLNDGTSRVALNSICEEVPVSGGGASKQTFRDKGRFKLRNTSESKFIEFLRGRSKSKLISINLNTTLAKMFVDDRNLIEVLTSRLDPNKTEGKLVKQYYKNEFKVKPKLAFSREKMELLALLDLLDTLDN